MSAQPPQYPDEPNTSKSTTSAIGLLDAAAGHMRDRASTYDQPTGERSMAKTVAALNAVHGTNLTEAQGWDFMATLKQVRMFQNGFHQDSAEDRAAYVALCGEAQDKSELP